MNLYRKAGEGTREVKRDRGSGERADHGLSRKKKG